MTAQNSAPPVACETLHPFLFVNDVRAAAGFYTAKLGFWLAFIEGDPPVLAGVNLDRVQVFLERGTPSTGGCSVYFVVGDVDELYTYHRDNGVRIVEPPADRPYGLRDYTIEDLDGYTLQFGQRLQPKAEQ
jgi:uncharacterized glyoxalase superfamily protein PhnB